MSEINAESFFNNLQNGHNKADLSWDAGDFTQQQKSQNRLDNEQSIAHALLAKPGWEKISATVTGTFTSFRSLD